MGTAGVSESPIANNQPPATESLLEFRAGKMILQGTRVHPNPRKGLFRIVKGDEGLIHVQWMERGPNILEDDYIVFPDEAVFEKVQQSSGRVYLLNFIHDDRKFFFWMQESKIEGDEQLCKSVNYFLNRPLEIDDHDIVEASAHLPVSDTSNSPTTFGETSERVLGNEKSVASSDHKLEETSRAVQLADLQRILTNLGQLYNSGGAIQPMQDTGPSFSEILRPDVVLPLLKHCDMEERLAPYLPEGVRTAEAVAELMQSPQFHQQLESFTHVLRSGQIDLSQFGFAPNSCDFTVVSFLEAIEDHVTRTDNSNTQTELGRSHPEKKDKEEMDEPS